MYLLNRCSAQTEYSQTGSPEVALPTNLLAKQLLLVLLLVILLSLSFIFIASPGYSQETSEAKLQASLEEDPLAEPDADLGLEEDPLGVSDVDLGLEEDPLGVSDADLGLEEDPLAESDADLGLEEDPLGGSDADLGLEEDPLGGSDADLGLEEDPLADSDSELGLEEDPLAGESINQETVEELSAEEEEEIFPPRVDFSHEVKTIIGGSETKGLSVLEPLLSEIKELRLVTTYDQSVKVQTSPRMYNYFRLSISFSQNYEMEKKRMFDGFASLREIYSNYRVGSHQLRYGTQIFGLGKVDLDKVIDVLHMSNIKGLYTFDPDDSKDAIPSIRYNWFQGEHTATLYMSPIGQQTFGMRFTEFREEVESTEEEEEEEGNVSFLRDYYGLQYQWTGDILDARFGLFHWFDSNPYIKFEYQRVADNSTTTLQGSFENMLSNYDEHETRSDFLTLELDAIYNDMVWKLESGLFKNRNLYSYEISEGKDIRLSTVRTPHFAFATSFERTFKYFYWLMIYSHRKSYDVPADSQIFLYENESTLIGRIRDVVRNQVSGVAVLKTPDNSLRITLLNYQTWPFVQRGFASIFTWERYKEDMELELKFFRLETEKQKMLENKIKTNQIFLTYIQKFSAN